MPDTKISALSASPYLVGSEVVPVVDAGLANEKATIAQINAGALIYLDADYTLTSTTSEQKLFNTTTNGRLTLGETGLYEFDGMLYITGMSATSGNGAFGILGAGTATLAGQLMQAIGNDNTTPTTAAAQGGNWAQDANSFTTNSVTAATGTALAMAVKGIFKQGACIGTPNPDPVYAVESSIVYFIDNFFDLSS
jgi:hypothetical protein